MSLERYDKNAAKTINMMLSAMITGLSAAAGIIFGVILLGKIDEMADKRAYNRRSKKLTRKY